MSLRSGIKGKTNRELIDFATEQQRIFVTVN